MATDREALIALFKAANGHSWENARFWCSAADLRDWYGVTVNDDGRVVELRLLNNKMSGNIGSKTRTLALSLFDFISSFHNVA